MPASTDTKESRIGTIAKLNASEQAYNERMRKLEKEARRPGLSLSHTYVYYDGLSSMLMGLDAGNIDEMSTYKCVAKYISAQNKKLEDLHHTQNMADSFCCAVRKEDTDLCNSINNAIKSMREDGTLNNLIQTYITSSEDFQPVEIPKTYGADTIRVGVTGDLPPLDLILADGRPAGFNTAMVAEIGKRIGKNIELVQIESSARASAITSKKIDVVFWVSVPYEYDLPANIDQPEELAVTSAYYLDDIVHVGLKK